MQERHTALRSVLATVLAGLLAASSGSWAGGATATAGATAKGTQPSVQVAANVDDATLSLKAKAALQGDPSLSGLPLQISVKQGVVTLSGEVASEEDRQHAIEVLSTVDGVKSIKSADLKIKS